MGVGESTFNQQTGSQDALYNPQPSDPAGGAHGRAEEDTAQNDAIETLEATIISDYTTIQAQAAQIATDEAAIASIQAQLAGIGSSTVPTNSVLPTIVGSAIQTSVLTVTVGAWTGQPTSYSVALYADSTEISGFPVTVTAPATSTAFTLTSGQVGHAITARVIATNGIGASPTAAISAATAVVTASSAPTVTSSAPPSSATVGTAYTFQFTATGSPTPTWSATGLPSWATLTTSGFLSGTPTTAGTQTFSVTASSTAGSATPVSVTLTIAAAPVTPTFSAASPPAGTVGTSYSYTLVASGTPAVTAYAVSAGALPAGLTLNATTGVISGTPTTAGTQSGIIFSASNGGSLGYSAQTSITIAASVGVPVNTSPPVIAGTMQAGNVASITGNVWTNSPTLAYQWYDIATSSPAPVQSAESPDNTTSATVTITLTGVVPGHLLTLLETQYDHVAILSVTGGGTWVHAISSSTGVDAGLNEIWYCLAATGGSTTVTVTMASTQTVNHQPLMLTEWNMTGATLDTSSAPASGVGTSASPATPSFTPSQPGELLIGLVSAYSSPLSGISSGWTALTAPAVNYDNINGASAAGYMVDTFGAAQSMSWSSPMSASTAGIVVAFKPAAASTPITGATASTYNIGTGDVGDQLQVRVSATNGATGGTPVVATSALSAVVQSSGAILDESKDNENKK